MVVKGNDLAPHEIGSVLLKKFGETLMKGALIWYLLLSEHSIDSFEMLVDSFIKAYARDRKVHALKANIFRIAQGEFELLQEFVTIFQKERMLLPAVPDEWAAEAFTKGLNPRSSNNSPKLKESLLEFQATTWQDVHNWYESKIRIEDDQLRFSASAKGWDGEKNKEKSKDDFNTDLLSSIGWFSPPIGELIAAGIIGHKGQGDISIVELVLDMSNIREARFSKLMRSDPDQRYPNLWCKHNRTNVHRTGDCQHLCEEVEILLKNGHLREFLIDRAKNNHGRNRNNAKPSKERDDPPCLTINMIFGGNEINSVTFLEAKKTKVSVTHTKRFRVVTEDDITFTEKDVDGLLLPHNDVWEVQPILLVKSAGISQANWKYHSDHKTPSRIQFGKCYNPRRDIASHESRGVMKIPFFEVVDDNMGYNIILERPWLHEIKVVP
ncbi:uncharacterized protein [Nicotiana sylvestris]|uniref:Uncharacterized protein LOC104243257 n=1 Tax=Nicotiana sylvestris TaxID=4096 RepID=A0A1U7YBU0_NICSY|nr:PREDICTED: uncharacterized protein LOC104243257 [Nicotiana sylvestris]